LWNAQKRGLRKFDERNFLLIFMEKGRFWDGLHDFDIDKEAKFR